MSKAINKPIAQDDPAENPYEDLYGKPLTKEEAAVMHFNLINFVETLVAMDRQHQEWLEKQKEQKKTV